MHPSSVIRAIAVVLVVAAASPAHAAPVTVSAGEMVIFNFNAAQALGLAQVNFTDVSVEFNMSGPQPGTEGTLRLYGDLDGMGQQYDVSAIGRVTGAFFAGAPELSDGAFSLSLTLTAGSLTADPYAQGRQDQTWSPRIWPTVGGQEIPEPASLALAGLALGAAALVRRRAPDRRR